MLTTIFLILAIGWLTCALIDRAAFLPARSDTPFSWLVFKAIVVSIVGLTAIMLAILVAFRLVIIAS